MTEYVIGTGGWAYFKVDNKLSLKLYSSIFDFVEVNYTFYQYPSEKMVEEWRHVVPADFTFSVRCHQHLTHKTGFVPTSEAFEIFYKMRSYCDKLNSQYLVLETPANYVVSKSNLRNVQDFFSSLNCGNIRLVWEYRAPLTSIVTELMRDLGVIQCVDLSRQLPSYNLDVTYSRLFGKGQHNIYQFTDDELAEIAHRSEETGSKTVILSYHGLRMNSDAARFKQYQNTGTFMPVTAYTGVESAKAVLSEDTKFPASKAEILSHQGWKVIDQTKDKRVHLSEILAKIPDKTYSNLNDLIKELEAVI